MPSLHFFLAKGIAMCENCSHLQTQGMIPSASTEAAVQTMMTGTTKKEQGDIMQPKGGWWCKVCCEVPVVEVTTEKTSPGVTANKTPLPAQQDSDEIVATAERQKTKKNRIENLMKHQTRMPTMVATVTTMIIAACVLYGCSVGFGSEEYHHQQCLPSEVPCTLSNEEESIIQKHEKNFRSDRHIRECTPYKEKTRISKSFPTTADGLFRTVTLNTCDSSDGCNHFYNQDLCIDQLLELKWLYEEQHHCNVEQEQTATTPNPFSSVDVVAAATAAVCTKEEWCEQLLSRSIDIIGEFCPNADERMEWILREGVVVNIPFVFTEIPCEKPPRSPAVTCYEKGDLCTVPYPPMGDPPIGGLLRRFYQQILESLRHKKSSHCKVFKRTIEEYYSDLGESCHVDNWRLLVDGNGRADFQKWGGHIHPSFWTQFDDDLVRPWAGDMKRWNPLWTRERRNYTA